MAEKTIPSSIAEGKPFSSEILESVGLIREDGGVFVSSRNVALHFHKKHKHVLDEIRRIESITPESFYGPNFRPVTYQDAKGESRSAYLLTRDGFTLLAMGFTGTAAIRWKLKYIAAFNALEAYALTTIRAAALTEGATRAYSLSAADKRLLNRVVYYRRKGLGVGSIARLTDADSRRVSFLLKVARSLGRITEGAA